MSTFTTDLDGLTAGQLEDVARHLQQTYHLNFGSVERQDMMFFRCSLEDVQSPEPVAVFWRELTTAAATGGPVQVTVPRAKPDQYRVAELLKQSHARAVREATGPYGAEAAAVLAQMCREWDHGRKLSGDEIERAEWVALPG